MLNKRSMPDAFVILFFVVMLAAISTHFIPAGFYQVAVDPTTNQSTLIADSFQFAEQQSGVPLFAEGGNIGFLNFAFEGMVSGDKWGSAIGVMMFIILTGGAFGIIMKTHAVDNGILALIDKTKRFEIAFIPILFVLFSFAGAIFGMGEEAIAFCIVLLPLMKAIGYDGIITVLVTYVATQIGFATSWMNPFSVAIAQGIAGLPLMSGLEFRLVMWLVFTTVGLIFTMRYASRIKSLPVSSSEVVTEQEQGEKSRFTFLDSVLLSVFLIGIIWVIWGVVARGYYIPELASQFFTLGCVIGVVAIVGKRLSVNDVADAFKNGAKDLLPAAMIVGMAKGIVIILGGDQASEPSVLNTVLHYTGLFLSSLPETVSAVLMFVFQSIFNFFIASGSGQAALTMPIMAPLADILNLSRQIAVIAFQLGDGLTNIIIPTSAALIGCLGVTNIDWLIWAKFIWRFMLVLAVTAMLFIVLAVQLNLT
ncbi:putative basic amino acid antiporter YfcC [Psychrosphaera aquimarina]|uniref:Basic amino acid antiporter YfcC n=1 Tax=Psychrosphaera aquimarina TaxID=2044854 RepID=A0ABU3QX51_9GAMM|nr:putative basic amino acid antiporter YfcC [Psychrosphaera aquimarina]MDU0112014.1 putative basic amino acid antiporter YfcC [Psychrosphaera aquimarina]